MAKRFFPSLGGAGNKGKQHEAQGVEQRESDSSSQKMSDSTKKRVAAAKSYIEGMYRSTAKEAEERRERRVMLDEQLTAEGYSSEEREQKLRELEQKESE